ncbi:MOSC N-terminal beta barrel domain-containing protein [Psychrosphaera sp. F3M07]|uniref:MOSC domain-containing protein n=1 Tax=Psychrosphaera sp. F3M07 TaxID=2841560 RepID=UPI001C0A09DE|nr:MOSC N-terminal beta barrel domain-containing protein [Psychrosphaera sp. F3M07]MBU2919552.1 MOSC N-terminal beta barrel domain-containing protein [Psychrosphaera sp. F3M07]
MVSGVISELVIYPVKSLQGINLTQSLLTEKGLQWDRHWMVVNEDGLFLTQRSCAKMATIHTAITETHLVLTHPDHTPLEIALNSDLTEQKTATVWKSECQVLDEGKKASDWLVNVLGLWRGQTLSLVRMNPSFERQVSVKHSQGNKNTTHFADGYPFLLTNTASLDVLNSQLLSQQLPAIPMNRFRGNIILDNVPAFIEHQSESLKITRHDDNQTCTIDFCNPCERCNVPGIDQLTGLVPTAQQPLKTLFNMEHVDKKGAFFGQNAVLATSSKNMVGHMIYVGDKVSII